MTTKPIRFESENAPISDRTSPLLDAEILSVLEKMTPVQQMELIEWEPNGPPEHRQNTEFPSILQELTSEQQKKLIELMNVAMAVDEEMPIRIRREGEFEEFNIQKWLKIKD